MTIKLIKFPLKTVYLDNKPLIRDMDYDLRFDDYSIEIVFAVPIADSSVLQFVRFSDKDLMDSNQK